MSKHSKWTWPAVLYPLISLVIGALVTEGGNIAVAWHQPPRVINCAATYLQINQVIKDHPHAAIDIADARLEQTCHIKSYVISVEKR